MPGISLEKIEAIAPDQASLVAAPDLMAVALTGRDIEQWAASRDIALVRG
jgi:hypothetical protein